MGVQKYRAPLWHREVIQTLTNASTATRIKNYGVTLINNSTSGNNTFVLNPPVAGVMKYIAAAWGSTSSTGDVIVQTHSSSVTFFGTTADAFTLAVGSTAAPKPQSVTLIGQSSASWAIVDRTTGVTLAATTR